MSEEHARLLNEIRYAERLCARMARLYRRLQSAGVFFSLLAGSAALSQVGGLLPPVATVTGAVLLAICAALLFAVRPGDKASGYETEVKRYAQLRTAAAAMDVPALSQALSRARENDGAEIEALRDVAWNDVMAEIGRPDVAVPLNWRQRTLACLA